MHYHNVLFGTVTYETDKYVVDIDFLLFWTSADLFLQGVWSIYQKILLLTDFDENRKKDLCSCT